MNLLQRKFQPGRRTSFQVGRPQTQLLLEELETRLAPASVFVVPVSHDANATHLHNLADAVAAAGAGGLVTIEPGVSPDLVQPITVTQKGITIQGDPNIPASILPSYQLKVLTMNVTLTNLNLGSVQLGTLPADNTVLNNTISKCV